MNESVKRTPVVFNNDKTVGTVITGYFMGRLSTIIPIHTRYKIGTMIGGGPTKKQNPAHAAVEDMYTMIGISREDAMKMVDGRLTNKIVSEWSVNSAEMGVVKFNQHTFFPFVEDISNIVFSFIKNKHVSVLHVLDTTHFIQFIDQLYDEIMVQNKNVLYDGIFIVNSTARAIYEARDVFRDNITRSVKKYEIPRLHNLNERSAYCAEMEY